MGPLAGKIWRIGLMGAGATPTHVLLLVAALEAAVSRTGHTMTARRWHRGGAARHERADSRLISRGAGPAHWYIRCTIGLA